MSRPQQNNFRAVTEEEREILERGELFQSFVEHPAWKELLDAIESKADEVLAEHRRFSQDPHFGDKVLADSARKWSMMEEAFEFIQRQVLDPIQDREVLLKELRQEAISNLNLVKPE